MIQFKCSCCGQLLQLGDEWAGKVAKCPYSGQFMQVPLSSPKPAAAPPPAAAARAAAPAGKEIHNPFGPAPFVAPPKAVRQRSDGATGPEFDHMAGTVARDAQQEGAKRSVRKMWERRGTLYGAACGAVMGLLFGVVFSAAGSGSARGEMLLALASIFTGGVILGAGVGGLIGPAVLLGRPGIKKLSTPGAIHGAMYGTFRVAGMGALGGLVPGLLRGAFNLMADGQVANAIMATVLSCLLLALGWAAAGAMLGAFFGAVLGALGGYDS